MMDIVEREAAVAELEELLASAVGGHGRVAVVSGAVGVGKSAVLQTFADRVVEHGALAIVATGSRTERNLPMGVLTQLFHNAPLSADERSRVADLLYEGTRAAAATGSADEVAPTDAWVTHGLGTALLDLSERYPLAIIVDDVHDADRPSLVCLSYLARRVRHAQMLAVFGYPEYGNLTDGSLQAELLRSQYGSRVRLSTLTETGVRAVAAARVGEESADRFAAVWHSLSGGSPLLVSGLLDDHQAATAGGDAPDEVIVGDCYAQAVVSCLRRGDPRRLAIGQGLAVLAEPDLVDRLVSIDPDFVTPAIRALTAAGVLGPGGFRHPAARAAVLADIDRLELADLHRRAASLVYERGGSPGVVAEQLRLAGRCGEPWAVPVLEEAARQALREGRVEPAVAFLELARQECTDEQRGRIMTLLVRAEWRIDPNLARSYLGQLAESLHKGHLRGEDSVALAKALLWHGQLTDAKEVFEHLSMSDWIGDPDIRTELAVTRDWLRCTFPQFLAYLPAASVGSVRSTIATVDASRRREAVSALTTVLGRGSLSSVAGTVEQILRSSHLDEMTLETVESALLALIYGGRADQAGPWCDRFIEEAESHRAPGRQARLAALRAEIALRLGNLPQALHYARRALEIMPPSSWGVSVGGPLASLVRAATAMGNYDEVRDRLDQPVPEGMFETRYGLSYLHARGRYSLAAKHASLAMRDFRRCGELMAEWDLDAPGLVPWRVDAAEACLAKGRTEQARQLVEQQLDRSADIPRVEGMALRLLAATSLPRHRPMLLRRSTDLLQDSGDRYELARTLLAYGEAYQAVGEHRRASGISRRARALAQECQAALVDAAGEMHPAAGGDVPCSAALVGPAALLSDAERRVAGLAAVGYTNREISERLYVTVSTVEQHLTRTYRKLDVTSRAELPADLDVARPAAPRAGGKHPAIGQRGGYALKAGPDLGVGGADLAAAAGVPGIGAGDRAAYPRG